MCGIWVESFEKLFFVLASVERVLARDKDIEGFRKKAYKVYLVELVIDLSTVHRVTHSSGSINVAAGAPSSEWHRLELFLEYLAEFNHKLNRLVSLNHIRLIPNLVNDYVLHGLLLAISKDEGDYLSVVGHDQLVYEGHSLLIDVSCHHRVLKVL
jgi:hypothetical protein